MLEERRIYISESIRQVPDFPKKGILFHDVTTLLLDPKVRFIFFTVSARISCHRARNRKFVTIMQ